MSDDASLIATLLVAEGKTRSAAAAALGISRRTLQDRLSTAAARGITIRSSGLTPEAKLKLENVRLKAEVMSLTREVESADRIRETIFGLSSMVPKPPEWLHAEHPKDSPGIPMTIWSDWHWGERVFKEQVGGVNEFNRKIAKVRVKELVDRTIVLAKHHMVNPDYPGIVVCLGGDFITGDIHEELRETNEGTVQQSLLEAEEHLLAGLLRFADEFGKVFVPCVVGNHGRSTLKPRHKNRIYTSYEWNLYCHLERHLRDDKRFLFSVPGEADAYFKVFDHRFMLTHGDSLGVKGGDGIIGALGPIARGTMKVGRSQAQVGRNFDTLLMGHWHTYIPRGEAVPVIVNGTLKGFDEFAHTGLRVSYSRPSQALWFVHPTYGVTAQWQIFVDKKRQSAGSSEWVAFEKRKSA